MGYSPLELDPVVLPLVLGRTVLDLGCGFGHWGQLLGTHYRWGDPTLPAVVTGVDAFGPNVEYCRSHSSYAALETSDALTFLAAQPTAGFDTVLAIEIIEHLSREDGERLLRETARVARRVAVFTTPNWEYLRPGLETMTGFNEFEHHLSGWSARDFRRHGYVVRGVGHRVRSWPIRGVNRLLDALPTLDHVLAGIAVMRPSIVYSLVAYRRA